MLTQSHNYCYPYFNQIIIYALILDTNKNSRNHHFWDVTDRWGDTITSSLLSIIRPNDHLWMNLSHEKNARDSPSGPYLSLGMTQSRHYFSPYFTQIIIYELTSIMKKYSRDSPFWAIAYPWDDTITSLLLYILHPNYHLWINLSHEEIARGYPFGDIE